LSAICVISHFLAKTAEIRNEFATPEIDRNDCRFSRKPQNRAEYRVFPTF